MGTQISTGWRAVTFQDLKTLLRHWEDRRPWRGRAEKTHYKNVAWMPKE